MVRPERDKLSGLVEMDETFMGGVRSGKRGRGAEGMMLGLIAVEDTGKGIGRIRLSTIPGATGEAINKATFQMVDRGSTIRSDGWDGYKMLTNVGYVHAPITPALAASGDATKLAHHVASLLKRWWLGMHHGAVSPDHLACYLDEFTFRFNRRTSRSRGKLIYRLVEQALQIGPTPGKVLLTAYSGVGA